MKFEILGDATGGSEGMGNRPSQASTISEAELHGFEAHGVGKRLMKVKVVLD